MLLCRVCFSAPCFPETDDTPLASQMTFGTSRRTATGPGCNPISVLSTLFAVCIHVFLLEHRVENLILVQVGGDKNGLKLHAFCGHCIDAPDE